MYSPVLGRFLSADTIVPDFSAPQSLNRFSYVRNRPLNRIDPSGHVDCDKNQWGGTCESSSDWEKDDADAHNNLCAYDPAACEYNTEEVAAVLELFGSILLEPVDWYLSFRDCANGDCSGVLLGMLPFVPSSARKVFGVADDLGDAGRAVNRADDALETIEDATQGLEDAVTKRPGSFRKRTIQDAWDNALDGSTGGKLCPTCGQEVHVKPGAGARDCDIDHQPPWSTRDLTGMNRSQVLDEYNRGTRLECPHCNRGRGARLPE